MSNIPKRYKSLVETLSKYRKHYGAFLDIFLSPYFHIAVFVWLFFAILPAAISWWQLAIEILPTMIGFTLAGYAIMLSFAADKIGPLIASEKKGGESTYIRASTTFFHFIFVQILCLLNAFVSLQLNSSSIFSDFLMRFESYAYFAYRFSAFIFSVYNLLGSLIFFYAIALSLATLVAVYRLTGVLDLALTAQIQQQPDSQDFREIDPDS